MIAEIAQVEQEVMQYFSMWMCHTTPQKWALLAEKTAPTLVKQGEETKARVWFAMVPEQVEQLVPQRIRRGEEVLSAPGLRLNMPTFPGWKEYYDSSKKSLKLTFPHTFQMRASAPEGGYDPQTGLAQVTDTLLFEAMMWDRDTLARLPVTYYVRQP